MTCIYSHEDGAYCDKHSHGAVTMSCSGEENCPDRKVLTNADRLRATTDEELAEWLSKYIDCSECAKMVECPVVWEGEITCADRIMAWLKSPAEEG